MKRHTTLARLALVAALVPCAFLGGCRKPMDLGQGVNGVYTNKFFGFSISHPDGWVPVTRATMRKLGKEAARFARKSDSELARMLERGDLTSYQLFMFAQYEIGTPGEFNHNIVCSIDKLTRRVDTMPKVKREIKRVLSRLRIKSTGVDGPVTVGSNTYERLGGSIRMHGVDVAQEYYIILKKGYALTFVLSYEEGNPEYDTLKEALATVTFMN